MTTQNHKAELHRGVIVPIITPYHLSEIFALIDHIKQGGVTTIFLLGTTGEALKVPHLEKIKLIGLVNEYLTKNNDDHIQLLVGITSRDMHECIELMKIAHQAGAFASVISPLVVDKDATLVVETLLKNGPGDILLYNYPTISNGQFIPIQAIKTLLSEERIIGIKDSSGNVDYFNSLLTCKEMHPSFKVYFGPEKSLDQMLKQNIDGFVPGTGNICPELACRLWSEKEKGPWKEWDSFKEKIKDKSDNYVIALKMLLKEMGYISNGQLF